MKPENHEEYLRPWAKDLGPDTCIVSVDYKKAPEFPFPYALEECFDIYRSLVDSKGACIGLEVVDESGRPLPSLNIVLAGDSAGGNFAAGVTIKIIEHNQTFRAKHPLLFDEFDDLLPAHAHLSNCLIPKPEGLLLVYPALNFDMACWIPPTQAPLLRPESSTSLASLMKSDRGPKYHEARAVPPGLVLSMSPSASALNSSHSMVRTSSSARSSLIDNSAPKNHTYSGVQSSFLSLTSRMSYFSDRILTPELQRSMALLYIGTQNPNVSGATNPTTDYYLSPVVAPESVLSEFPRIWMMVGECDPLVDDTVVFAARVRAAVRKLHEDRHAFDYFGQRSRPQPPSSAFSSAPPPTSSPDSSAPSTPPRRLSLSRPPATVSTTVNAAVSSDAGVVNAAVPNRVRGFVTRLLSGKIGGDQENTSSSQSAPTLGKSARHVNALVDSDVIEFSADDGSLNFDPDLHVTVKIYAGLSHAFLNMHAMLPEASHASSLCSKWVKEIFEQSLLERKRRRSINRDLLGGNRSEYGGSAHQFAAAGAKKKSSMKRTKYVVGDSSDEESSATSISKRDVNSISSASFHDLLVQSPITHAKYSPNHIKNRSSSFMALKRPNGVDVAAAALDATHHLLLPRDTKIRASSAYETAPTASRQSTLQPSPKGIASPAIPDLFLLESELLDRRQRSMVREAYVGVETNLVLHDAAISVENSPTGTTSSTEISDSFHSRPMAD